MKPVTVGRYDVENLPPSAPAVLSDPFGEDAKAGNHCTGWVETEDWILFQRADGALLVWNGREKGGAVLAGHTNPTVIHPQS